MKRFLPRFDRDSWGGPDVTGKGWCEGHSFAVQWLGLLFEINFARVTGHKGKAR